MAASSSSVQQVINFEEIIALLDDGFFDNDDGIIEEINSMETGLQESSKRVFTCEVNGCSKSCKTKGGLQRHIRSKHKEKVAEENKRKEEEAAHDAANRLHPLHIKVYVRNVCEKLANDLVYPEYIREKFKDFAVSSNEALEIFNSYKEIILKFKGDPEHFLAEFNNISQATDNPLTQRLDNISYQLLTMELSTLALKHLTKKNIDNGGGGGDLSLSDRELAALQYLAGHVVHKIFLKIRKSKDWRKPEFQQCIEILKAFKIEPNESHKLVKAKDRGGLWYISKDGEHIFLCTELLFRKKTKGFITCVDYNAIVQELRKDYVVRSKFGKVVDRTGILVEPDIAKDLLEKLLGLYLRVRSHSYAKDIKEKQKIQAKTSGKKRSLRTELKKITSTEEGSL